MVKLTPLIGEILSPAVADFMSSPFAQGVMDILLCEDLCAAPAIKASPLLCKDIQVPGLPRIKKLPTRFNFGGPGGGVSIDWGGSSDCGGFFNSCGGGGGSGGSSSCGWFSSCGGVDSTGGINGRDFACSVFPSLWFCQSNNPLLSTPPTSTTVVNVVPTPSCDPNIKFKDFVNLNPQDSTMAVTRYLASCLTTPVPYMPDLKAPIITVTAPTQNLQVSTATVRVTGYADDVTSKVKIQGVLVSTVLGANGIYFDTIISVPADGVIKVEAADAAGNLAIPVSVLIKLPSAGATDVSLSYGHVCAIINGGAKCWGDNTNGELGVGSNTDNQVFGLTAGVTAISAGFHHTCAIVNGGAKCWGSNSEGQLGNGNNLGSFIPVTVVGLESGVTAIGAGSNHSCAVANGIVKCWGLNRNGQVGDGTGQSSNVPQTVIDLNVNVIGIAVGLNHACALANGGVRCWGDNSFGQAAQQRYGSSVYSPIQVIGLETGVSSISAGFAHSCAISNGEIKCWGQDAYGQLGDGTFNIKSYTIVPVSGITNANAVTAGFYHTCALANGNPKCWGANSNSQLGDGTFADKNLPQDFLSVTTKITKIVAGGYSTCVIIDGAVKCFGLIKLNYP